jgi:hypothetical protein
VALRNDLTDRGRQLWRVLRSRDTALALFLCASVFWIIMVGSSRERPWGDARPIWDVAEALVERQQVSIDTRWPPIIPLGRNNKVYAVSPLLPSLVQVPGAVMRHFVLAWAEKQPPPRRLAIQNLSWPLLAHVGPAALGALTCLLFFQLCGRLGVSRRMALWGTAAVGFGSIVAVYARSPYSEITQICCFTGFFGRLLIMRQRSSFWGGVALGAWAGLLLNSKLVYGGTIAGAGLLLLWTWRREPRRLLPILAGAAVGFAPGVAAMLLYNWVRWGGVLALGPKPTSEFVAKTWIGVFGMFLSPGKSIFLYAPPLLLSLFALPVAFRKHRDLLLAMLVTIGPVVYVSASMIFWTGDYAWGPRYLVFATPVLLLPGVLGFDEKLREAVGWARRGLRGLLAATLGVGIFVQVLGAAFYWDLWIRVSFTAAEKWLGKPNLGGSPVMSLGVGCGSCFEQMYSLNWLPPFQPIVGHWWLLKHVPWKHDWATAEADAPWHTYTKLRLDIKDVYPVGRTDWWMLDYVPNGNLRSGIILLVVMSVLGLLSIAGFVRTWRATAPPPTRAGPAPAAG